MGDMARMLLLLLACLEDMLYGLDGFTKLVEARREKHLQSQSYANMLGSGTLHCEDCFSQITVHVWLYFTVWVMVLNNGLELID